MALWKILLVIFVGLPLYLAIGRILINLGNKLGSVFFEGSPCPNTFLSRLLAPWLIFCLVIMIIFKAIWVLLRPFFKLYRALIKFAFKSKE